MIIKDHMLKLFSAIKYNYKSEGRGFIKASLFLAISRVFQMIAFFLPIKILIMLSSDENPSYLSEIMVHIKYEEFIILLIILVPVVFSLHLLFGVSYRRSIDSDAKLHVSESVHIYLIGRLSNNKVLKLHNHSSKAFSDIILFVISSMCLLFINTSLFITVLFLVILDIYLFTEKAFYKDDSERITWFKLHKRQFIEYTSSLNYLAIFLVLVALMELHSQNIYSMILALLISRQAFQALQRFSVENLYLAKLF